MGRPWFCATPSDRPRITRCSTLRGRSAGIPGNQRCDPLRSTTGYLPLMGDTAGGFIGPTSCSCSLIEKDKRYRFYDSTKTRRGSLFEGGPLSSFQDSFEKVPSTQTQTPLRSVDLVKGLSSPLLCAPAWRPAHLLGCSTSPRLAACLAACSARHRLVWLPA